jgi:hypothetical protein
VSVEKPEGKRPLGFLTLNGRIISVYGSHPVVFITTQTTFILSNTTQVYFESDCAFTVRIKINQCFVRLN